MSEQLNAFVSYSANHEDVLLNRLFREQPTGFYIDVGAAHPIFENDTKALYDRGWCGINIEPNKAFFDILNKERSRDLNLNIAVSEVAGERVFYEVVNTGLSTCAPEEAGRARENGFEIVERQVKSDTLRNILDIAQPSVIDLLKIDVEGFESNVIRSNDWGRFRPHVILVEATFPETPVRRPDIVGPILIKEGYRHVYFDGLNDYYIEKNFSAPGGAFDIPLNIFDRFTPLTEVLLAQERSFLREECKSLKHERANALVEIASLHKENDRLSAVGADLIRTREDLSTTQAQTTALSKELEALHEERGHRLYLEEDLLRTQEELSAAHVWMAALGKQMEALDAEIISRLYLEEDIQRTQRAPSAMHTPLIMRDKQFEGQEDELAATRMRMSAAEAQHATAEARLDMILRSTSWRITRPLRALARPRRTLRILAGRHVD